AFAPFHGAPWARASSDRRPLTVVRYPDGIAGESFYQKNLPEHAPPWIRTWTVLSLESGRPIRYPLCEDLPTLVWLANQAAVELHPWHSRIDRPHYPDWAVVDLDPAEGATYRDVIRVALAVKDLLNQLGLRGYPKTSGATGLHVYIPLQRLYTYRQVSRFVGHLGQVVAAALPEIATTERMVRRRTGKVYLDHLQNLPGKTIVAPYAVRPRPGAPVSTPLTWDEVPSLDPASLTIKTVPQRLARVGDLFRPLLEGGQELTRAFDLWPDLQEGFASIAPPPAAQTLTERGEPDEPTSQ
ncbi:MAG: non-homologous end-joining DNA ligase, partial [Bacillota bacterium]|nr:non-homologous end-joining DNA ligase [Bacillota bacterium]